MPKGTGDRQTTRFDDDDETPIERCRARKCGGSLMMTLRADSARAIGLEPSEVSADEVIEFVASETTDDGRLILDFLDRSEKVDR